MLMSWWKRLSGLPAGKRLFSRLLASQAPYSGSIGAVIDDIEPGYCRVLLKDRRAVRNHLNSVHAVALMNLAELSSGLSVLSGLGDDDRGIVTKFEIEFVKKARGTLTSECRTRLPAIEGRTELTVPVEVKDAAGDVVCRARAHWTLDKKARA